MSVLPSTPRLSLAFLAARVALVATFAFASPASAAAKPRAAGKACVTASQANRPSPVRACQRVGKAPKALPAAVSRRFRRRAEKVYAMMGSVAKQRRRAQRVVIYSMMG